eukprot:Hpha_TRINITY_DN15571_c2_g13::TRINITY_DN15571_c2_g13_i1::g.106274::m.106274/K18758/DIS3L2; DIS3-like exonuclease 2
MSDSSDSGEEEIVWRQPAAAPAPSASVVPAPPPANGSDSRILMELEAELSRLIYAQLLFICEWDKVDEGIDDAPQTRETLLRHFQGDPYRLRELIGSASRVPLPEAPRGGGSNSVLDAMRSMRHDSSREEVRVEDGWSGGGGPARVVQRIDPTDGTPYSQEQFFARYGSEAPARWAAAPESDSSATTPAGHHPPRPSPSAPTPYSYMSTPPSVPHQRQPQATGSPALGSHFLADRGTPLSPYRSTSYGEEELLAATSDEKMVGWDEMTCMPGLMLYKKREAQARLREQPGMSEKEALQTVMAPMEPRANSTARGDGTGARERGGGNTPTTPLEGAITPASSNVVRAAAPKDEKQIWAPHVSEEAAIQGVLEGKFLRGRFEIPKKYTNKGAFVRNPLVWGVDCDVLIDGVDDRNRALHGDEVIVEILPYAEWRARPGDDWRQGTRDADRDRMASAASAHNPTRRVVDDVALPREERSKLPDGRVVERCFQQPPRREKLPGIDAAGPAGEDPLAGAPPTQIFKQKDADKMPTGRVVRIWKREHKQRHVCRAFGDAFMKREGGERQEFHWVRFASYDERYPHFRVATRTLRDQYQHTIERIRDFVFYMELETEWEADSRYPWAKPMRLLGAAGQVEVETQAILVQCGTDYTDEFDERCMEPIADTFAVPTPEELKKEGRRDFRLHLPDGSENPDGRFITTIDPATARDLDDALSCDDLGNGRYRVGVHIADVATFVPMGSALDEEASKRATSVYMVQKVVPMLPRKLCEEYCSLNTISDKYAFSVEWEMDEKGRIKKEWFGQTVIRSQCKMAYEDAQSVIDGRFNPDTLNLDHIPAERRPWTIKKIKEGVANLWKIAKNMREERFNNGALTLNQKKMGFDFEDMNASLTPKGYHLGSTAEANWLVEEMMVRANCRAMEKCFEWLPENSMARYHERPDLRRFDTLATAIKSRGMKFDPTTGELLRKSLDDLAEMPQMDVIKAMSVRCMMMAKYCSSDETEREEHSLSHYALSVPYYTHFTSPIRRYPDLVVHRCLKVALEIEREYRRKSIEFKKAGKKEEEVAISWEDVPSGNLVLHTQDLHQIASHCNERKTEAREASERSIKLFFCLFLQAKYQMYQADKSVGPMSYKETVRATCMSIKQKSFCVWLEGVSVEKEIFLDNGKPEGPQLWQGTAALSQCKKVLLEWKEGQVQAADLLTSWTAHVFIKEDTQRLDFVVQLQPPPDSELQPKVRVYEDLGVDSGEESGDDKGHKGDRRGKRKDGQSPRGKGKQQTGKGGRDRGHDRDRHDRRSPGRGEKGGGRMNVAAEPVLPQPNRYDVGDWSDED